MYNWKRFMKWVGNERDGGVGGKQVDLRVQIDCGIKSKLRAATHVRFIQKFADRLRSEVN